MLAVGHTHKAKGYVCILMSLCGKRPADLERLLGYAPGALTKGYKLGLLDETVGVDDFEFRAYTNAPDGVHTGSKDNAHERLKKSYSSHPIDQAQWKKLREQGAARLNRKGAEQVCKVFPNTRPTGYPPGDGIAQFELMVEKKFKIVLDVPAGGYFIRESNGGLVLK